MAQFKTYHPDVRVSLRDGEGSQVVAALINQDVEFAVTTLHNKPAELIVERIASDPFVAACHPEHPVAQRARLTLAALSEHRLVGFKSSSATRRLLDDTLAKRNIELPWFDEVDQLSSLVGYLRSGHFVGIVPRLLGFYLQNVIALPVTDLKIERHIYLARRRDAALSVPSRALWKSVVALAETWKKHSGISTARQNP